MNKIHQIYWIERLDAFNWLAVGLIIACLLVLFFSLLIYSTGEMSIKSFNKTKKMAIVTIIISVIILVFIPTTDKAYIILKGGKEVINSTKTK